MNTWKCFRSTTITDDIQNDQSPITFLPMFSQSPDHGEVSEYLTINFDQLIRTEKGSEKILQMLEKSEDNSRIFEKVMRSDFEKLMTDRFSNRVIESFLKNGTTYEKDAIWNLILSQLTTFVTVRNSSRVILSVLDGQSLVIMKKIVKESRKFVATLLGDPNGVRFLAHIVGDAQTCNFIAKSLMNEKYLDRLCHLSTLNDGSKIIQKCIGLWSAMEINEVFAKMLKGTDVLFKHSSGCEVLVCLITNGGYENREALTKKILDNFSELTQNQNVLNVVKTCFLMSTKQGKSQYIEAACKVQSNDNPVIVSMILNNYGYEVVDMFVDKSTKLQAGMLLITILSHIDTISRTVNGRRFIEKLNKKFRM